MGKVVSIKEHKQQQQKLKRKKRRAGSLKWVMAVLVCLACMVAGFSLAQSSLFNVSKIVVAGNSKITAEAIVQLSGIKKGENIYAANTSRAEVMIGTNYWVDQVQVKRSLPSTVKIDVKERVAVAAIGNTKGLILLDFSGIVLGTQKLMDGLPLMIISGVDDLPAEVLPGHKLETAKVKAGLGVVMQMNEEAAGMVSEINVKNTQDIFLRTTYGIDFILGDKNDFLAKYDVAKQIMQTEDQKGNLSKLKYIDVSIKEQPTLSYLSSPNPDKKVDEKAE